MFSPDHTVLEFMLTNSRLGADQVAQARKDTPFSMDDFTFARILFGQGKIDVACLWEPDVTLALASRPGAHRLFSTADATELVADTLVARREFLDLYPGLAVQLARTWFAGVEAGRGQPPGRRQADRHRLLALPRRAGVRRHAEGVRLGQVDGHERQRPDVWAGRQPPAFDRVYNQADGIWVNYPQAEIKERFAPVTIRDDRIVRRIWEAEGKKVAPLSGDYNAAVAVKGRAAVHQAGDRSASAAASAELGGDGMAALNQHVVPQVHMAAGMYIRVEGNTDTLGEESWNLDLQRAARQGDRRLPGEPRHRSRRIVAKGNGLRSRSPPTRPSRAGPATAAPTSCSSPRSRKRSTRSGGRPALPSQQSSRSAGSGRVGAADSRGRNPFPPAALALRSLHAGPIYPDLLTWRKHANHCGCSPSPRSAGRRKGEGKWVACDRRRHPSSPPDRRYLACLPVRS